MTASLQAGRTLDALVAEKVMDWDFWDGLGAVAKYREPPEYSTDIASAWQVVEKMREKEELRLTSDRGEWEAAFGSLGYADGGGYGEWYRTAEAKGDSPALAICLAALEVVRMRTPFVALPHGSEEKR